MKKQVTTLYDTYDEMIAAVQQHFRDGPYDVEVQIRRRVELASIPWEVSVRAEQS
jgi:hypothetical protein